MALSNTQGVVQAERKGNHWLICVAGSTPSVITETLYCLKDRENFPNKVVIFTTLHGKGQIEKQGMVEQIANLCRDYQLPLLTEDQIKLRIVTDANSQELEDIRTSEDQEAMADFLTREIRSITYPTGKGEKRPDSIHASLAGGRKSMSFYMGNIFAFFANSNDELSHVLVDQKYEIPGFWYPTPENKTIEHKNWQTGEIIRVLDAKEAQLELSTIPFVRLSNSLVSTDSPAFHQLSYRQLVDIYQVTLDPAQIKLTFDLKNFKVNLNGRVLPITNFDSFLLYYLISADSKEGSLSYQKELFGKGEHTLTQALWQLMARVTKDNDFVKRFNSDEIYQPFDVIKDYLDERNKNIEGSAVIAQSSKLFDAISKEGVISEKAIERMMTDIRKALEQTEGKDTVNYCKVVTLKEEQGQRKTAKGVEAYLGLLLPADQIHFINE